MKRILLLGLCALTCAAQELRVYAIDVEGGKATLYVSPSGQSMLVDAGYQGFKNRDADRIVAAAKAAGVTQIDYLEITHYHGDHVGGVPQLAAKMPIRNFVDHGQNFETGKDTGGVYGDYLAVRAKGFVARLAAARKPVRPVVLHGKNNFQGGVDLARKLMALLPDVTAVFAASDMMAFGTIRALMEAGRRIPQDVSVMGFDNVELASIVHPPLTTIHQPKYEIGQALVEILLRLAGRGEHQGPEHRLFAVELVERQSCMERGDLA